MKRKNTFLCMYLICLTLLIYNINCHSIDDAKRLLADTQNGYEKNFRPVLNQSNPIDIYIGLDIISIREFDEVKEQLTITALIHAFWFDEFMTWDPKDYGGLDQLVIESGNVWTPNLVLLNSVDKLEKIGDTWQLIRFLPNGFAHYYPGNVLPASCHVDITYYPWDRQKCTFTFAPWAQLKSEITFTPYKDKVMTTQFSENGAWDLFDSSVLYIPHTSLINFSLNLQRKPRFVLINVILPIIFMAFLNTMIYTIPVECGERISYSITVLLALAVFLTLVSENLPKVSSPMSFFGYYLLVVLLLSVCIAVTTIFSVRLYYKNEADPVPTWLTGFVKCLKCECRSISYKRKNFTEKYSLKTENAKSKNEYNYGKDENNGNGQRLNVKSPVTDGSVSYYIRSHGITIDSDSTLKKTEQDTPLNIPLVSWKEVSLAFDKVFFVLFFSVIIIATTVFFALISTSN